MSKGSYILKAFVESPWAIQLSQLAVLGEIVARHASGEKLAPEEIQLRIQGAARPQERLAVLPGARASNSRMSVAILPLVGTIFPRANLMTEMSGGVSAERFGARFAQLVDDPSIGAIILDVHSPGGSIYGIAEVAQKIYQARGKKPIVAISNHMMASGAYWIGSAADELVVSPSGDVGSIGVYAVHEDISTALEQEGIRVSLIKAGKYKVEGNPWQPLTDEARQAIQQSVDDGYEEFLSAVARHRGVSVEKVRAEYGEGRMVGAQQAVTKGMADRIESLDETIARLLEEQAGGRDPRAAIAAPVGIQIMQVQEQLTESGQAPGSDEKPTHAARARLAGVGHKSITGESNMLRKLQRERADKIARAQQLLDGADAEERELSAEERAEFVQLLGEGDSMGEVGELDRKIEQEIQDRERLRTAAERKFSAGASQSQSQSQGSGAVKPEGNQDPQRMKRADFDELEPNAQAAYIKGGGKVTD